MAFTVTGKTALFLTNADALFPLLSGRLNRSVVTGKSQAIRIDQPFVDRNIQELLLTELEYEGKRILWF